MFRQLGEWVYAHRRGVITSWVVVVLVALYFALQLPHILRDPMFAADHSDSKLGEKILQEHLQVPTTSVLVMVQDQQHSILSWTDHTQLQQIADKIKTLPHVKAVTLPDATSTKDGNHFGYLSISFNQTQDVIVNELPKLRQTISQRPAGSMTFAYAGGPVFLEQENWASITDLQQVEMLALPLTLLVLLLGFRTWTAALLPLLTGVSSAVLSLALLYGLGHVMQFSIFVLNIPTTVGIAVGVDYALLVVNRFREELRTHSVQESVVRTFETSGRALFFSGMVVIVGILSLAFFDSVVLRSVMVASILVVSLTVCCSLTLIPALLGMLGERVNRGSFLPGWEINTVSRAWERWARVVMRDPWASVAVAVLLLALFMSPLRHAKFAVPGLEILPNSYEARQNMETLYAKFGQSTFQPLVVALEQQDGNVLGSQESIEQLHAQVDWVKKQQGVTKVLSVFTPVEKLPADQVDDVLMRPQQQELKNAIADFAKGHVTQLVLQVQGDPNSAAGIELIKTLRAHSWDGYHAYVTGAAAENYDFNQSLLHGLPRTLAYVFVVTFVLLLLIFRSLVIPLKALLMNCLSLLSSFGILVWLYVEGHGHGLLQGASSMAIDSFVPVFVFAFVFGTSMDYEVFMLTRIQEEYESGMTNEEATAKGLSVTSRLITAAAMVLIVHTGAFFFTDVLPVQQIGLGLALSIAIDATIIRLLLVPALMKLFGDWNWKLPWAMQEEETVEEDGKRI